MINLIFFFLLGACACLALNFYLFNYINAKEITRYYLIYIFFALFLSAPTSLISQFLPNDLAFFKILALPIVYLILENLSSYLKIKNKDLPIFPKNYLFSTNYIVSTALIFSYKPQFFANKFYFNSYQFFPYLLGFILILMILLKHKLNYKIFFLANFVLFLMAILIATGLY